ncbi:hypothetical protein EVAR_61060_1 [Eumeta japonica]|uniref:Uncharacterized protein n=1 Tax=Eumeta variegata TaxID=151549 RepID=A0A4C1Z4Y6_EUMVA|nr:hypothetical protein EVAR_61060_1 [Eumeta japonica]
MSNKNSLEALDRIIRDLRSKNSPIGGCTILFSETTLGINYCVCALRNHESVLGPWRGLTTINLFKRRQKSRTCAPATAKTTRNGLLTGGVRRGGRGAAGAGGTHYRARHISLLMFDRRIADREAKAYDNQEKAGATASHCHPQCQRSHQCVVGLRVGLQIRSRRARQRPSPAARGAAAGKQFPSVRAPLLENNKFTARSFIFLFAHLQRGAAARRAPARARVFTSSRVCDSAEKIHVP